MQWPQVTLYKCHTKSHNRMVRLGTRGRQGGGVEEGMGGVLERGRRWERQGARIGMIP